MKLILQNDTPANELRKLKGGDVVVITQKPSRKQLRKISIDVRLVVDCDLPKNFAVYISDYGKVTLGPLVTEPFILQLDIIEVRLQNPTEALLNAVMRNKSIRIVRIESCEPNELKKVVEFLRDHKVSRQNYYFELNRSLFDYVECLDSQLSRQQQELEVLKLKNYALEKERADSKCMNLGLSQKLIAQAAELQMYRKRQDDQVQLLTNKLALKDKRAEELSVKLESEREHHAKKLRVKEGELLSLRTAHALKCKAVEDLSAELDSVRNDHAIKLCEKDEESLLLRAKLASEKQGANKLAAELENERENHAKKLRVTEEACLSLRGALALEKKRADKVVSELENARMFADLPDIPDAQPQPEGVKPIILEAYEDTDKLQRELNDLKLELRAVKEIAKQYKAQCMLDKIRREEYQGISASPKTIEPRPILPKPFAPTPAVAKIEPTKKRKPADLGMFSGTKIAKQKSPGAHAMEPNL